MNQETKRRKYGENYALYLRNYQRARSRVLTRLAQENPDRYKELLEEERAKDEAEGKAWIDLSGRTKRSMGSAGAPNREGGVSEPHPNGDEQEARNVGGEA